MKITPQGVLEIAEHEGLVLGPYKDSVGVWTYGVGHTAAADGPDPAKMKRQDTRGWSQAQVEMEMVKALRLFDEDLNKYEARVAKAVKVPLKSHEFDALVSFDFNTGGIFKAKLTEAINRGDKSGDGFMGWIKPKEITKRRQAEMALFCTGRYDANGDLIPVYDALGDGRLRHRMNISAARLGQLMPSGPPVRPDAPIAPPVVKPGFWAALMRAIFGSKR
jgi:lysozyme